MVIKKRKYLSPHLIRHSIITPKAFLALSFLEEDQDVLEIDCGNVSDAEPGEGGAVKADVFGWTD